MMFKSQTEAQKRLLVIRSLFLSVLIIMSTVICTFLINIVHDAKAKLEDLDALQTYISTQHNKLLLRESFLSNADAIYNTMAIRKDLSIEGYMNELKTMISTTMSYYNNLRPIEVNISYKDAPINESKVVPVRIELNMKNIFDYAPVRLVFVLFNNLRGTILCKEAYITKTFQDNMYEKINTDQYLFSSRIVLEWFVLLKTTQPNYAKSFTIEYKPANKRHIEATYNMSTWNDSFMLYPQDLENIKIIHSENLQKQNSRFN